MYSLLNKTKLVDDETRKEIIKIQKFVEITNENIHRDKKFPNYTAYHAQMPVLNGMVSQFNELQYYAAIQNRRIKDSKELFPIYSHLIDNPCISAKSNAGGFADVFVTYRVRKIGFHELFMKQVKLFEIYAMFKGSVSQLAYYIFENARTPVDGKYIFGIPSCGYNPYERNPTRVLAIGEIKAETTNSISAIKKRLTDIVITICGDDIKPISSKMARAFIAEVCCCQKVDTLIDDLFLTYYFNKACIEWHIFNGKISSGVSRHPSWCSYHLKDNSCIMLEQPCHSTVDCAFYHCNACK